jgi:monofunctional biosynthetic peptidoglycan transglycosylase
MWLRDPTRAPRAGFLFRCGLVALAITVTDAWPSGPSSADPVLSAQAWQIVNDGVMGGLSQATLIAAGEGLIFRGALSRENNGGFVSARRAIDYDLEAATGVQLTVRGDGRRYQFRVRQDKNFDGVAWRATFATGQDWQTVTLDFEDFEPVFRGQRVSNAGPVVPAMIRQIGFLLADGPEGDFRLDVAALQWLRDR